MRKRPFITVVISFLLIIGISLSFSFQQAPAPVPPNITIQSPDPSLPVEAKLLSGRWAGKWNCLESRWGWDYLLYVEKIESDSVQVVHAWGEYNTAKMSCHCEPNWARVQKVKVTYLDGKATLKFITPGNTFQSGYLKKIDHLFNSEDEGYRGAQNNFIFTVNKKDPHIMKGQFTTRFTGRRSPNLDIKMKKID